MDAAQKLLKASAILLAFALLMAAPGWALPTLVVPSATVAIPVATRTSDPQSVTSSDGTTAITFATSINYAGDVAWLYVSGGTMTPTSLTFSALSVGGFSATVHTATVTLTPTSPAGVAAVQITVTYDNTGSGGGGGSTTLAASQTTVALTSVTDAAIVTITNISSGAVNVTASVSANAPWLSATLTPAIINAGSTASLFLNANLTGLAATTYQGTVTLTPTSGTALPITVNLSVGSSGGGSWVASPNTLTWSYTTNSGVFPTPSSIAVTATTGSTSYTVNTTQNSNLGHWLLVAANGQLAGPVQTGIPVGAPFTLSAGVQVNNLTQGTYTDEAVITDQNGVPQATVTVSLTVNGGSTTGLTLSPSIVQFSAAVGGAQQSLIVNVTSSTGGFLTVNGCNSVGWLSCTLPSNTSLSPGVGVGVTVYANPAGLTATTYTGKLLVQVGSQTGEIDVSLAVGSGSGGGTALVAPATLNFAYEVGTSPSFVARQLLVITGPAGAWSAVTTVTSPEGGTWLGISPSSGTALPDPSKPAAAPVVTIDPTGLGPNLYGGSITVKTPGGTQVIQVLLNVYSSTVILPNPVATLIFTAAAGAPKPSPQGLFWSDSDNALDSSTIAATANNSWITLSNASSGTVTVSVDQSTLTAGLYSGSVTLTQTGAANSPTSVPILFVVTGSGGGVGALTFSPSQITLTSSGGATPAPATLGVSAATQTAFSATIAYSSGSGWLTVSPLSGTTPASLTVSANPAGLTAGNTYNATISFSANGSVQTVPVSFTVSGGGTAGNVTVLPGSLTFAAVQGSSPANQTLSVSSAAGAAGISFTVTPITSSGGSWLSASVAGGTTPLNPLTISVNSSALPPATYQGNILIAPTGGTTVNIPVTLTVTASSISALPTLMTFSYRLGDAAPASQQLTVSGSAAFTATATSTGNWLVATPTTGTAPGTVNVSINKDNISSTGTLNGTVLVAATGGASGSTTVNVTLNVTSLLPTISRVTNAASYATNAISPGEIITLFASDPAHPIGPATPALLTLDINGNVATSIGGVQVTVQGYNCPMIYASASQVSAVVPYEVAGYANVPVLVKYLGQSSNGVLMNVATTIPGLFTANSSGTGPGAILNSDPNSGLSVNTANNAAARGGIVVIYMTGEGQTSPGGVTGKVTTIASPPAPLTPGPLLPVSVTIGGQPANWTFAGEAPGLVSGVMQLNVVVPTNIAAGDQPIVVTIGGVPSQQGVTVSVK